MAQKKLAFTCWNCKQETTMIVTVIKPLATQSKMIAVVRNCQYCHQPNKIEVSDNVDVHVFILGRDKGFVRYTSDRIPVLQGEKDL